MASNDVISFGVVDWIVFIAMLAVSTATGVYHAFAKGGQKTTSEYLLANRKMRALPIATSYFVSLASSIAILGLPAESFLFGIQFILSTVGIVIGHVICAFTFVPLVRGLDIISIYEGGMKAVIWADVFQCIIMTSSVLAVLVIGTIKAGGMAEVMAYNNEHGRLDLFEWDPDPTLRYSFWSLMIGQAFKHMAGSTNQGAVQRILASKSTRHAQKTFLLAIPFFIFLIVMSIITGLVLFAYYDNNTITMIDTRYVPNYATPDQILVYFVSANLGHIYAFVFGTIVIGLAFGIRYLGTLIVITSKVIGVTGGPVLGAFTLGMCFPRANTWGAYSGVTVGLTWGIFVFLGSVVSHSRRYHPKPIFKISFTWYTFMNWLVTVVIGVVVSEIARCIQPSLRTHTVDDKLLLSCLRSNGSKHKGRHSYQMASNTEPNHVTEIELQEKSHMLRSGDDVKFYNLEYILQQQQQQNHANETLAVFKFQCGVVAILGWSLSTTISQEPDKPEQLWTC
uniref:Sodium-dependent multivitamin transporter-like n=1 Tax=Saccoglossus kowalevskii TaxID=10224 RepID=A0ABM0LUU7_SACKO|nr:PREDICTED: sodium-dependent multivitamin transporter-like [Saccoglossus kowalevskii]